MNGITSFEVGALADVVNCTFERTKSMPTKVFDACKSENSPLFLGRLLLAFAMNVTDLRCSGNLNPHLFEKLPVASARKVFVAAMNRFAREKQIDLSIYTPTFWDTTTAIAFISLSNDQTQISDKDLIDLMAQGSDSAECDEFVNTARSIMDFQDFTLINKLRTSHEGSWGGYYNKSVEMLGEGVLVTHGSEILPWIRLCRNRTETTSSLQNPVEVVSVVWTESGAFKAEIKGGFDCKGEKVQFHFDPKFDWFFKEISGWNKPLRFCFQHTAFIDKHILRLLLTEQEQKGLEDMSNRRQCYRDEIIQMFGATKNNELF